jgi:CRP/FNR family transcriptional regulator, anaerobic regulatory protein
MYKTFYDKLLQTGQLTASDKQLCETTFEPISFSKSQIIEHENKIPNYLYFIVKGYMRLFYYDDNGDEVTTFITSPNNFITSFLDFIHQKPSNLQVECITDCELLKAERSQLMQFIEQSENFKQHSLIIFQQALANTETRANDLATLSAELRYKKLVEEQPEIIQNVPIQYIASYLGIKPQSLSRIRSQINK